MPDPSPPQHNPTHPITRDHAVLQDHAVRVWTRAPDRAAPAEVAQAFDKGVIEGQTKAKKVV